MTDTFMFPLSATGDASIIPAPPWHYSGDMLTIEFRTDPAAVADLLPEPLALADDDPGAVAIVWADWQSCSDTLSELLDPTRAQYKEAFVVVRCQYEGKHYSRCVYIWVDKDYALVRGHFQGYPKKLGEIHMTRPVTVGKAGPRLEPGGVFGATCSAYGHRLIDARFEITAESDHAGFVNALPMIHNRRLPRIEADGSMSLDELVTMSGYDVEISTTFAGTADIKLHDAAFEELTDLTPHEMIGGYWRSVGVSWNGGTTLLD